MTISKGRNWGGARKGAGRKRRAVSLRLPLSEYTVLEEKARQAGYSSVEAYLLSTATLTQAQKEGEEHDEKTQHAQISAQGERNE